DKTVMTIKTAQKDRNENIKLVNLSRNFGKESAIFAGLSESRGDYVSIIDADLQQDPKIVSDMVKILDDDCEVDCVAAYQDTRHEGKLLTFYKNCFYKLINKMTEINFKQGASDFRTMRRTMVDAILQMQEYYRFSKGIFSWVGFNTKYIPYEVLERHSGKSKWSFWKLFKYAFEGIISFSTMPLRIATVVGVLTSFVSSAYMLIVIVQKLFFGISTSGYATIVVLILLLGGLQLFALGILGEYIARNYVETKKRPIYIAKEIIDYENGKNK
ncbi:MAG: glycosyltransferase family 2 protein, partial [Oscillospiraceae bacterium]